MIECKVSAPSRSVSHYAWHGIKVGAKCKAVDVVSSKNSAVQVSGVFGNGGCLVLEGSIDGVNYYPVVRVVKDGIVSVGHMVRFIKPVVESGDNLSELNCNLLVDRGI